MRFFLLILIFPLSLLSQTYITGYVYEKVKNKDKYTLVPLSGASVYWKNSQIGTTTNEKGEFKLKIIPDTKYLIISYVGYKSDTIRIVEGQKQVNVVLESIETLKEVEITEKSKGEYVDKINPIKTEVITTAGLEKLACCNLSESFENSGTVDVNYTDAITGAKQIQMLGLAGIYTQILGENMPLQNYLSQSHGLTFIPGQWMQSIQVSKGTSSVINGFESITGQINVEFKKPHLADPFFANLYQNSEYKTEFNSNYNFKINEELSSGTLIHLENLSNKIDHNNDKFLDLPLNKQLNVFQRFNYEKENKFCFQYGIKFLYDDKKGGQIYYNHKLKPEEQNAYGIGIKNNRIEILTKHGFLLPRKSTSLGIQLSAINHSQNSFYGKNKYNADEKYFYSNLIFKTYIYSIDHIIDIGTSFTYNNLNESFKTKNVDTNLTTKNRIPGAFIQYTYNYNKIFSIIFGFRYDYSSLINNWIYTPRLHAKYDFSESSTIRFSVGKGSRFSYPIAENLSYTVSSRNWFLNYDKHFEDAWNLGLSFTTKIKYLNENNINITFDAYKTYFIKQVVVDYVTNPHEVRIFSSESKNYSNSYQLNISTNIYKRFEITLIGRYNDVRQTFSDNILQIKPMVVPLKILGLFSYTSKYEKWSIDITNQWNSSTILPNLSDNPEEYRIPKKSEPYLIIHTQITRRFKIWEIYAGIENLLNYKIQKPIIAYNDPFGPYFDASLIYAPIMGRLYYVGIRFKIK
jgi:hypothetical protein